MTSAALEAAASSSSRGSGWLPRAARRALRRHRSRAGALPRGRVDHAGTRLSSRSPSVAAASAVVWSGPRATTISPATPLSARKAANVGAGRVLSAKADQRAPMGRGQPPTATVAPSRVKRRQSGSSDLYTHPNVLV
eukprot:scaffold89726_cov66-Phaeocystis_antarctica.AAC.5